MKILTVVVLFFTFQAQARVAALSEVPLVVKQLHRETTVKADGTFKDRWTWRLKVQRRDARDDSGTRTIRFYKSFEDVKVIRAGTRTDGTFREISLKDLQERAVTDESPGFSSLYEYVLSFPDVQEGSDIELDYEVNTKRALEPEFWGQSFQLDSGAYQAFSWKINSDKPLFAYAQDPGGVVETVQDKRKPGQVLFRSKASFSVALADEADPFLSNERKILLMASVLNDWSKYGQFSAKAFEERAQERLPAADEKFAASLKKDAGAAAKIQKILQRISSRYRYFGDWRSTEQMYVPRHFSEIERTLYGDCKDFALVAVRMLRLAGLDAKPVWILNDDDPPGAGLYKIPTDNAFNHVIVRVVDGADSWWVDPTNTAARVNYMADEVAGRPGLVLDPAGSKLVDIRKITPGDYRTVLNADISQKNDGKTLVKIVSRYEGYSPISAGEQIKADGLNFFVQDHVQRLMPAASIASVKADAVEVERETNDLHSYEASADFENFWVRTSAGIGFSPVREDVIEKLRNLKLADRAGDVALGKVYTYDETLRLRGFRRQGDLKLDCEVDSPWLSFSQKVTEEKSAIVYHSIFSLKEAEMVLTAEAKKAALALQKDLRDCAGRVLVLLKPL